jgi:hypothetical protein
MHRFAIAALGAAFLCGSALAADAPKKTLHELFDVLHDGGCTTIARVREAGAVIELTPEQFQFIRAFWMAIPPISRTLPPGDKAFIARDAEETAVGLIDSTDGAVCAVFPTPDWMQVLIDQIGRGEVGKRPGQAL